VLSYIIRLVLYSKFYGMYVWTKKRSKWEKKWRAKKKAQCENNVGISFFCGTLQVVVFQKEPTSLLKRLHLLRELKRVPLCLQLFKTTPRTHVFAFLCLTFFTQSSDDMFFGRVVVLCFESKLTIVLCSSICEKSLLQISKLLC